MNLARILLATWLFAAAAACVWRSAVVRDWRARRREVRAARDQVRDLHSGHIDNLPRSGGPKGGDRG